MCKYILPILILSLAALGACGDDSYDLDEQASDSLTRISTFQTFFKDEPGRYLFIHGVNVSGSTKVPAVEEPISYTGKPFPLDEADWNFKMLRDLGFNAIRLLVMWDGIEPEARGQYDEEYLDYVEQIVAKANDYGIYVLLDFHQDVFSHHLFKYYYDGTDAPELIDGSLPGQPRFNNKVQGDGAPKWAVQACLPDKNVYSPEWGLPRALVSNPANTNDIIPWNFWGINNFISLDSNRSFAVFFAGNDLYPNYKIDGQGVQDYLQEAYTNSWLQVARRVKHYPNVLGYDIMNEPYGWFFVLTIYALLYQEAAINPNGSLTDGQIREQVELMFDDLVERGMNLEAAEQMSRYIIKNVDLPHTAEDFSAAGLPLPGQGPAEWQPDIGVALNLNLNFDREYLQALYERVGNAIQAEDPDAVIFIEPSMGTSQVFSLLGYYTTPMLRPAGLRQVVFEPHYYTDIYPYGGMNQPPRSFTAEEIRYRDYYDGIEGALFAGTDSLGNPPILLGEFGTYYNFNGIEDSMEQDYAVSAEFLDNYYEAIEKLRLHSTLWCYSPENTAANGEGWNKEDFSLLGPDQKPRAANTYVRTTPRFTSGKLMSYYFYSPLHYYQPQPGVPTPEREFYMEMGGLETSAPTEIFVPELQYPEGFYVYLSDGRCAFDDERHILYWFPSDDNPKVTHTIRIRPPWAGYGDEEWDYFFKDGRVMEGQS